jgi:GntR family transcriptional regulator
MELLKDSPLPLYFRVVTDLLNKLRSGELPPNSMITPEVDLAKQYGVSRNTVRHAISLLAKDGYLVRIPGKGTFVMNRREDLTRDQWVMSSIEDMLEITKQTRVEFGPMEILTKPPEFVLKDLRLKDWNKVCLFQGTKYRSDEPLSFLQVYLPYEIGVQVDEIERGERTVLLYIEEKLGVDITQVDQHMTVQSWSREDKPSFKMRVGDPKIVIKRVYFHEDQPVEVSLNHYPGNRFSLFYRILKGR